LFPNPGSERTGPTTSLERREIMAAKKKAAKKKATKKAAKKKKM
jgi:hypothetical protein